MGEVANQDFVEPFPRIHLLHCLELRGSGGGQRVDNMVGRPHLAINDPMSIYFRVLEQDPDLVRGELEIVLIQLGEHSAPSLNAFIHGVPPNAQVISGSHTEPLRHLVTQDSAHHLVKPNL